MEVEAEVLQRDGGLGEPWAGLAQAIEGRPPQVGRMEAFQRAVSQLPERETVQRAVLRADPTRQPRWGEERSAPISLVPRLPERAELPEEAVRQAQDVGEWLDAYIGYAKSISPLTPPLFHESAGLALLSLAVARRVVCRLRHGDMFPNLAILWIAPTTLYAKSTGLNVPRALACTCMPHLLLPGEMTPESMIDELAGKQPLLGLESFEYEQWNESRKFAAQRGVMLDEASSLFVGMGKKDYQAGLSEGLLRLYDCEELYVRQTKGGGRSTIRDAYWTFLGATTPHHLHRADLDALWYEGLWPRFLLLTPTEVMPWVDEGDQVIRVQMPEAISAGLEGLLASLPEGKFEDFPAPLSAQLGQGVHQAYRRYLRATMRDMLTDGQVPQRLWGVYGRLAAQALKVALLLASIDWTMGHSPGRVPVVGLGHWARAQGFLERCRESVHRLPGLLDTGEENEGEDKVLAYLKEHGGWCTPRDVYRPLHLKAVQVKEILLNLEEDGQVVYNREMKRYRIKGEPGDEQWWGSGELGG